MARMLARQEGLLVGMSSGRPCMSPSRRPRNSNRRYCGHYARWGRTLSEYGALRRQDAIHPANLQYAHQRKKLLQTHQSRRDPHAFLWTHRPRRSHIGSYRRFVVSDMIMRFLEYKGYRVRHVMNIIDLADRSIRGAERADMTLAFTHSVSLPLS